MLRKLRIVLLEGSNANSVTTFKSGVPDVRSGSILTMVGKCTTTRRISGIYWTKIFFSYNCQYMTDDPNFKLRHPASAKPTSVGIATQSNNSLARHACKTYRAGTKLKIRVMTLSKRLLLQGNSQSLTGQDHPKQRLLNRSNSIISFLSSQRFRSDHLTITAQHYR
jgi:hypothetical protein